MANWWDAAPLANAVPKAGPAAGANWWDAAPLANEAISPGNARTEAVNSGSDRGALDAAARGVAQGFTANFGDEIRGLVEASGANPNDPASVYKLISGALKYWSGDAKAKEAYDAAVKRERELNKTAQEQHPYASLGGEVGGAVLLPLGAGAGAATLGGRMAAGAGTGAVLGGAAGAGEGQGATDSIARAATGAAAGAALGGVAPAAIEGIIRGGRAVAQPVVNAIRGVRDVDSEAARRLAVALERDIQADPQAASRLTPQEFAASVQAGGPATLMDIGGDTTRALARSAANTSPEGRGTLSRAIDDRFEGQATRVNDWLRSTFHYPDAAAQKEALTAASKNVNRPAYIKAYRDGSDIPFDESLLQISQAPVVQDAIRKAMVNAKNEAAKQGLPPPRNPFQVDSSGYLRPMAQADGSLMRPNLQFWDIVKRNLDRVGTRESADWSRVLREHLDDIVPSYAQARAGAAHFFGAKDALEAGQNFVNRNMTSAEARQALAKMSPTERQLFQDGFVSRFSETLNQIGDRRSVLNKIAESPAAREKLNVALGPQRAAELEAGLRVEGIMDLARGAVQGNSTTARQLAELGLAGGAFGFSGGVTNPLDPGAVMNAAIVYGALKGKNAINERLSRRVAEMLTSQDPRILMQGVRTVANNRNLFNALRSADRGLARVSGQQAPVSAPLQMVGVGRTEDQPNIPRPPGQ